MFTHIHWNQNSPHREADDTWARFGLLSDPAVRTNNSAQASNPYEVRYGPHDPHQPPPPALIVRYSKSSARIVDIELGPSIGPNDIAQIVEKLQALLLSAPEYRIGQMVMFATLALTGWFRYRDKFQLIPVP